jgi:hypothetical protein
LSIILAIVGGIIGGWALSRLLPGGEAVSRGDLLTTGVGALVGGIVASSLTSLFGRGVADRPEAADVVLRLPDASSQMVRNLDTESLAGVLGSILSEPASEGRLNQVILNGGRVRFGGKDPGDPWLRSVWRRKGPIRPQDLLGDPTIDIRQDINRPGG